MRRANKRNIFLIGMMGSGKTTIGKILAEHLGWKFDDSDHKIEHATGKSIVSIFSEKGEDYFRNLESDPLEILTSRLQDVSNRPLLEDPKGNELRLATIWLEREKLYRQTAHITIDASLAPQSCANKILKELKH